ncbi:MAG: phenylalanine--tRNA ligase subunit alpha [Actinomycetota bacterium]|nr:phenylalanine--tRNA ligase subunit alpha [Actinomycetota bacterium]
MPRPDREADRASLPSSDELAAFFAEASQAIAAAADRRQLEAVRLELLGRSSVLSAWKRALGGATPEERREVGLALNATRDGLEAAVASRGDVLAVAERAAALEADRLDLSELATRRFAAGHLHLVSQVRAELEDIFLGMGYEIAEGPEVESDEHNFTALNMPPHHPARSNQDSFYLDLDDGETFLLRSQTSPVQIRLLARKELPLYAVAPGRAYRRDTPDARHLPAFHQIEGIAVDRDISFADLAGTVATFTEAIFGTAIKSRLRPAYFPFTEPSAEYEVTCVLCSGAGCRTCSNTGWIELGGCGLVHPNVLSMAGVDPEEWSGFAFGFGIDRLAMIRYQIEDIRSLIENDVRFLTQF